MGSGWLRRALFAAVGACIVGAVAYVATSDGHIDELLTVGAVAPDFEARTADGDALSLSSLRGKWAVVFFYPKDDTPGCTKEACAFRDAFDRYAQADIVIVGVSRDSHESHERFRQNHNLPFPLVADESGAVQRAYGVPSRLGMAARVTFLVDPAGHIARVWRDVDPGVHANEVITAVPRQAAPVPE